MSSSSTDPGFQWWKLLSRYQWFVLIVAALGWLLDCMDQQLFNLARAPAMRQLLAAQFGQAPTPAQVGEYGGYATAIFGKYYNSYGAFCGANIHVPSDFSYVNLMCDDNKYFGNAFNVK